VVWVRLDDRFPEHPKIMGLSSDAFRAHIEALCYAGRNETDGAIPHQLASRLGHAEELLAAGLWERNGAGFHIHDFLDYNPSAAENRTKREQAAQRMRVVRANFQRTSQEPVSTPSPSPSPSPPTTPLSPPSKGGEVQANKTRTRKRFLRGDE
jgi:hypothetical protein